MDADLYEAAVEGNISVIEKLRDKIDQVTKGDGETILHLASMYGKTECVQFILTEFPNKFFLTTVNKLQITALQSATWNGHTDTVRLLINAARPAGGSPPSSELEKFVTQANVWGNTALHDAVHRNTVKVVKLLLTADPNHKYSVNNKSESPLYIAVKGGYKDIVKVICETCTSPSFDGPQRKTALHAAAKRSDTDTVELLINKARGSLPSSEFEKFIRQANVRGDTALHVAVSQNKVEVVELLLTADPNYNRWSESPLYTAVKLEYKDVVKVILELCASPTFNGPQGETALHVAAGRGDTDTVKLLINKARDVLPPSEFEKFIRQANVDGDTALHMAVSENKEELVRLLVTADPNHIHPLNSKSESPLYIAAKRGYQDNVSVIIRFCTSPTFDGPHGESALHAAVERGDTGTVKLLINAAGSSLPSSEFKKFIRQANEDGDTALHAAAGRGDAYTVELLIKAAGKSLQSPEFKKFIRQANVDGDTALHVAVSRNKVEVVKLLLEADQNHQHSVNSKSKSPLYMAVEEGYKDIVEVICESCTSPSFDGPNDQTALHAAAVRGDTVALLIKKARGSLPSSSEFEKFIRQANVDGDTALHVAVSRNKVEVVKLLLEADQNHQHSVNSKSQSPLYMAVEEGYIDTVKVIFESCTSPTFDGPLDKTALHAAVERGDTDTVKLLIDMTTPLPLSLESSWSEFEKFIRQANVDGDTALHVAVYKNKVEEVKLLLKADPYHQHSVNSKSQSPLYMAVEEGYKDIVKVICGSCISPTFDGPLGKTALHAAVVRGDTDTVRVILDKREDLVLVRDDNGWTAADYAASGNIVSVLDILKKAEYIQFHHDYSVYEQFFLDRPCKETGFHRAAFEGHVSTIVEIMKLYPDFIWSAVNEHGQNILHIAVDRSHKELVQAILEYCKDISQILNTKDVKGNTPLHLLVMRGCFIPELIRHEGIDRNAKNNDKYTPYELLYLDGEIKDDQLKIKEAFEDSEFINQRWNFGLRKRKLELITTESPVFPSTRYTKDAKFKNERDLLIKKEIKLYRARINTQIIVTALITTVTFTVGFTMPGGYHQSGEANEGSAVLSKKTAFSVFVIADTIALLLSMSSLALYFVASIYQDAEVIAKLVDASTVLNIISVAATMLTFVLGIFIVLPNSLGLLITVGVMSSFFLLLVILLLIMVVKDPLEKFSE